MSISLKRLRELEKGLPDSFSSSDKPVVPGGSVFGMLLGIYLFGLSLLILLVILINQ